MTTINPSSSPAPKNFVSKNIISSRISNNLWPGPVNMRRNAESRDLVTFFVFLLLPLCVYPLTARKAEREQLSITTKLSSSGQGRLRGRGHVVVICVICNRLSNPCSNPAHNTDCGALKKLSSCGQEIICTCIICLKNGAKKSCSGLFLPG